jgi:hypothetical protein
MHTITQRLTRHYDACLKQHGPTPAGMDWGRDASRLALRFDTILRLSGLDHSTSPVSLLDAGCGCALLLDHLNARRLSHIDYRGLDASNEMLAAAQLRHPETTFIHTDICSDRVILPADWVVANGILTERRETPHDEMRCYAQSVVTRLFERCRTGVVFNVLTTHVNYRDDNLFYWDPAEIISFAVRNLSRHVTVCQDTTLYDLFVCIRRTPWTSSSFPNSLGEDSEVRAGEPLPPPSESRSFSSCP